MCSIWGTTWLGIKFSLHYLPPATGAGIRFIIAGLVMYAFAAATRKVPRFRDVPWNVVLVLALTLFGLNYVLTYTGESHVSSGLTAVLFGVLVFFTFAFGHYMVGERTTPQTWFGAALGLAGVAAISLSSQLRGEVLYALAVIAAACSSAFGNVYAKKYAHTDPMHTLPPSMLIAGIVVTTFGLLTAPFNPASAFSTGSIEAILYLAIAGSAIAFFLNLWLLKHVRAWVVAMSALIIPVIAVIVGVIAGGERFGISEGVGAALVIAGVWLALKADANAGAKNRRA